MANKKPSAEQLAKFKEKFINDWWSEEDFYKKWVELWWINKDEEYEKSVPTFNYSTNNKEWNLDILRNIDYDISKSTSDKNKARRELQDKADKAIKEKTKNAGDNIEELNEVKRLNEENNNLKKQIKKSTYSVNNYYSKQWITKEKADKWIETIKNIYVDPTISDEKKKKKISYIIWQLYWSSTTRDMEREYKRKWYANADISKLSKDQLAEKTMYETYIKNYYDFKNRAQKYLDWLNAKL